MEKTSGQVQTSTGKPDSWSCVRVIAFDYVCEVDMINRRKNYTLLLISALAIGIIISALNTLNDGLLAGIMVMWGGVTMERFIRGDLRKR